MGALVFTIYHVIERVVKIFLPQKMFEKNISGQVVLITGGGSGIGRLMCLRFARLGATVVTWDINKSGNEETVDMIKKKAIELSRTPLTCHQGKQSIMLLRKLKKILGQLQSWSIMLELSLEQQLWTHQILKLSRLLRSTYLLIFG